MSDPIDKALDEYLSGNSQVSRRYRELDDVAVPPQLDQAVLAQARAAVAERQSSHTGGHTDGHTDRQTDRHIDELERLRQRRKRLMQWSVPAGLAASAVLVVSIVMQSGVQHEVVSLPQQPASTPVVAQEPGDRSSEEQGLVVLTQPDAQSYERPPALRIAPAEVSSDALSGQAEKKIESSAKRLREQQDAPHEVMAAPDLANEPAFAPSVVAPAPPAPVAQSAPLSAPPIPEGIQRSASRRAIDSAAIEASAAKQQAPSSESASRAASEAMAARNQQAASRRAESRADDDLSEIIVTGARRSLPAAGSGPRETVRQSTSAASQSDAAMADTQVEEPKHWLERIRQLRKDGKAQDADREWQRFREAYPDYAVAEADAARARP